MKHKYQIHVFFYKKKKSVLEMLRLFVLLPSIINRVEPCTFLWYDAYQNLQGNLVEATGAFQCSW